MVRIEGDRILINRAIWDSHLENGLFNPFHLNPHMRIIYIYLYQKSLVSEGSYEIKGFNKILNRGQCLVKMIKLASLLGITRQTLRTSINNLVDDEYIKTETIRNSPHAGTIVTILNYQNDGSNFDA